MLAGWGLKIKIIIVSSHLQISHPELSTPAQVLYTMGGIIILLTPDAIRTQRKACMPLAVPLWHQRFHPKRAKYLEGCGPMRGHHSVPLTDLPAPDQGRLKMF